MSDHRVRFAQCPTCTLNIPAVRTTLFDYILDNHHRGKSLLRFVATDQNRFVPEAEEYIIEALKWLGFEPDEGVGYGGSHAPYRQSERKEIYAKYATQLIESGNGYYAFDTAEELDQLRSEAESQGKTFTYNSENRNRLNNSLNLSPEEVEAKINSGIPYVIRFKIPEN